MRLAENFKSSPIGLKIFIIIYTLALVYEVTTLLKSVTLKSVLGIVFVLIVVIGLTMHWELIRLLTRILILIYTCSILFSFAMNIMNDRDFPTTLQDIMLRVALLIYAGLFFYYLGRNEIKKLFSVNK